MKLLFHDWNLVRRTLFLLIASGLLLSAAGCQSTTNQGLLSKGSLSKRLFKKNAPLENYPPPSSVQTPIAMGAMQNNPAANATSAPAMNGNSYATGPLPTPNSPIGGVTVPTVASNPAQLAGSANPSAYAQQGMYTVNGVVPAPQAASVPATQPLTANVASTTQAMSTPVYAPATSPAQPGNVPAIPTGAAPMLGGANPNDSIYAAAPVAYTAPATQSSASATNATEDSIYGSPQSYVANPISATSDDTGQFPVQQAVANVPAPPAAAAPPQSTPPPAAPAALPVVTNAQPIIENPVTVAPSVAVTSQAPTGSNYESAYEVAPKEQGGWRPGSTASVK